MDAFEQASKAVLVAAAEDWTSLWQVQLETTAFFPSLSTVDQNSVALRIVEDLFKKSLLEGFRASTSPLRFVLVEGADFQRAMRDASAWREPMKEDFWCVAATNVGYEQVFGTERKCPTSR